MQSAPFEWSVEPEKMTKIGNAIVLGSSSDIYQGLKPHLQADGWKLTEWSRGQPHPILIKWDLAIITVGQVGPVGFWQTQSFDRWEDSIYSNLILPYKLLRAIWPWRAPNCSVCFMAGSNPNKIMPGYSAYNTAKMGLLKLCEQLDFESPDAKLFALAPGYVDTKIHKPSIESFIKNERIERGGSTPIDKIYECLNWCIAQPKEVIGGRNICVSDMRSDLTQRLLSDSGAFKLRRYEGK